MNDLFSDKQFYSHLCLYHIFSDSNYHHIKNTKDFTATTLSIINDFSFVVSLVKLHYFQFPFLENCVHKKQKKSIKDQRKFCSNTLFKVFANFVSAHSKIWCSRFFYEQNDINFFIPPVGDLPEIEECLYLTTTMKCNSFQI